MPKTMSVLATDHSTHPPKVETLALIREWRCWREDGSYQGPCTEAILKQWATHERGGWTERHDFCGWQWYVMEKDTEL